MPPPYGDSFHKPNFLEQNKKTFQKMSAEIFTQHALV